MKNELAIGVVGAGGFAAFAAQSFVKVPGIKVVAVTDIQESAARQMADELNAKVYADYQSLLNDQQVDLVYIATPPSLHYPQSKMALLAGKHVICEKPAAIKTVEAQELADLAQSRKLLYTVNLMQRYNPLVDTVKNIVQEGVLGNFLHGFFENYASDEKLIPEHWFWDEKKSGGIFIEHGVHFFDLFAGWLGKGEVVHAAYWPRPDVTGKFNDRVQAVVVYPKGPVNFYHGFDQPKILDRQEMRLQFERGDITLYEWVPVKIRLHGLLKKDQLDKLTARLGDCTIVQHPVGHSVVCVDTDHGYNHKVKGRFKDIAFDNLITIESGNNSEKQNRYEQLVISMIKDQWSWIKDRSHVRVINDSNAIESLRMAEEATIMAEEAIGVVEQN